MTEQVDPRAQFRQLPDPVHPDQLVEVHDADPPLPVETPAHADLRQLAAGGGPV
ncbi:hypothetical protein [Modestobacter sp. VKM Ac-2984]|uniref:hypothetical protein n=1 Tax=Modestobacter sp. VKM Ac-2984 TaxID=3004138 RepID=UPI0022AA0C61|nr:hypothetical protein [Modestobacter sp. VKM Ac-2984]MCZ2814968.1 hypothetical protein [Modestobacter sp. VKM Ac-2984]